MITNLTQTVVKSARDYAFAEPSDRDARWLYADPGFTATVPLDELMASVEAAWLNATMTPPVNACRRAFSMTRRHPQVDIPLGSAAALVSGIATDVDRSVAGLSAYPGLRMLAAATTEDSALLALLSQDPCTLVRAAVALNRSTRLDEYPGLSLMTDPVTRIRDLLRDPTDLFPESDEDDEERDEVFVDVDTCSCVPQTGPARSLSTAFHENALMLPGGIPLPLESQIRQFGEWRWATQPHPEPMLDYLMSSWGYLQGPVPDHVAFSHAGHGVNSYSLNLRLAVGPLALLAQVGWGGVYMDMERSTAAWNATMTSISTLLCAVDTSVSAGYHTRDVLVGFSEFRGGFRIVVREGSDWIEAPGVLTWDEAMALVVEHLQSRERDDVDTDNDENQYRYDPPHQDPSTVLGVVVVEPPGEDAFAVAAIQTRVNDAGEVIARLESVGRQPFDISLGSGHLRNPIDAFSADGLVTLPNLAGPWRVRPVMPQDASWLSSTGFADLPVSTLEELVRVLHEVEAEQDADTWSPFNLGADEPIEFLAAFVNDETDAVVTAAYGVGLTEGAAWGSDAVCWRFEGEWLPERPEADWSRRLELQFESAIGMLAAFDAGMWVSSDAAYAASIRDDKDCSIDQFSPALRARLEPVLEGIDIEAPDLGQVDFLVWFAAGRAFPSGSDAFDLILDYDNRESETSSKPAETPTSPPSTTVTWLSTIDFEPGADAHRGGPWTLVVTRVAEPLFTLWHRDERISRPGFSVDRGSDGAIVRVVVESSLSFNEAIAEFGLDFNAFGSPTIWYPGVPGWRWITEGSHDTFPFEKESVAENRRRRELLRPDAPAADEGWQRLTSFVAALVALTEDAVVVEADSDAYRSGDPYVQLCREDEGALTVEAASSRFLDPPLSPDAQNTLRELGFEPPRDDQMPNYSRWLDPDETAPGDVAHLMVDTLRRVYGVRPSDSFSFAPQELYLRLIKGEFGDEYALNPEMSEARKARAVFGLRFPADLKKPD